MNMFVPSRLLLAILFAISILRAQEGHGYTTADIERGGQLFFVNCATCHGPDGDAVPDVNLGSGRFRRAVTDQDLMQIIRGGIPGTPMPPGNYSEAQAETIVAFLRSMNRVTLASGGNLVGDPGRGKTVVEGDGQCLTCHRVRGQGAFLGPDLSEIGGVRRKTDLERSLLEPSAEIRVDNHTVRLVTREGKELRGRLLNQDTYSVQLIDATGKLLSVPKTSLREFEIMKTSPMPAFTGRSPQQLADVVSYLVLLKGGSR